MTKPGSVCFKRHLARGVALVGFAAALGACTHTSGTAETTASIPDDYRLRHPIVIQETKRTVEIFVGSGRGGLTAAQRADVAGLAQTWLADATGTIVAEVPVNTPNARTAADAFREAQSILIANGVPPAGIIMHSYRPSTPSQFATIRLNYPKLTADAGPCGLWPEDIGPSIKNKGYLDNKPYWNFGCAYQHNMAAMVDNPADLVQPRAETPPYTARRSAAFAKYRAGTTTATTYPESDRAKLSETGK